MRAPSIALVVLILTCVAACSVANDPDPEDRKENVSLAQGRAEEGAVLTEPVYGYLYGELWDWDDDVDDLPPGFHYETDLVAAADTGSLLIEYYLAVDPEAEPGHYEFDVDVTISQWTALFEQKVKIRFRVEVRPARNRGPVELRVQQEIPESEDAELHLIVE